MSGHTQPTGPHLVHFSDVKEVVEIESGRFEFFKQMLTIGLGGIAGLAAIFTDEGKIPDGAWSKGTLIAFAICAIVVVVWSAMGISTYANHLRDVHKLSLDPNSDDLKRNRDHSEHGILSHARITLLAASAAAMALIIFAGVRLFGAEETGAAAAMGLASKTIRFQPGNPTPTSLDHFQTVGDAYLVTYVTEPNRVQYTVRVKRDKNEVVEITKQP